MLMMLEAELKDVDSLSGNQVSDSIFNAINYFGTLGLRTLVHDYRVLFQQNNYGIAYKIKCGLRGVITSAATVFGFVYPSLINLELGLNLQAIFLQIMGFLPAGAYVAGVLTFGLLISMIAALASDKIIDLVLSRFYKTCHCKLAFTESEIQQLMAKPSIKSFCENESLLRESITFLSNEFSEKAKKDSSHPDLANLLKVADKLRDGDITPLIKLITKKLSGIQMGLDMADKSSTLGQTPKQKAAQLLQQAIAQDDLQLELLLKLVKYYQRQIELGENKQDLKAQLQFALEVAAALNKKDQDIDALDISANESAHLLTPALDNDKLSKKQAQQQKLEPLLQMLKKSKA